MRDKIYADFKVEKAQTPQCLSFLAFAEISW